MTLTQKEKEQLIDNLIKEIESLNDSLKYCNQEERKEINQLRKINQELITKLESEAIK